VTRSSASLICGDDRTGMPQVFRIDLKTGGAHQLTEVAELDAASLALSPDSRSFCCFAGRSLLQIAMATLRQREIYRIPDGWQRSPGMSLTPDGAYALFAEHRGEVSRLRTVSLAQGIFRTVTEARFAIEHPLARPGRDQILYRQAEEALWLVDAGGANNRRLKLAPGRIGSALWSPDGKNVQYLNVPEDPTQLRAIREFSPDAPADRLVAKTSQFACFGANRDASVFVGASANRSSPTVLLLLRVTRREFTLCEHKATRPETVAPVFSPDSRRVFFQSDRDDLTWRVPLYWGGSLMVVSNTQESDPAKVFSPYRAPSEQPALAWRTGTSPSTAESALMAPWRVQPFRSSWRACDITSPPA